MVTDSGAMQSIPLKQSTANIDLVSPIGKWIDERGGNIGYAGNGDGAKQRSRQQPSAAKDDVLPTFARMRTHAVSVRAATNVGQKVVVEACVNTGSCLGVLSSLPLAVAAMV